MKNFLIISVVLVFVSINKLNAQLDTLNYLKQFEANKTNYIGKPLSYLLNNMTQIQPKTLWNVPNFRSKNYSYSTELKFVNKELSYKKNNIFIYIIWETPIPMSEAKYYQNKNHFIFTDEERSYYGTKIIKDIIVHR